MWAMREANGPLFCGRKRGPGGGKTRGDAACVLCLTTYCSGRGEHGQAGKGPRPGANLGEGRGCGALGHPICSGLIIVC